jgi:hypothetical protein
MRRGQWTAGHRRPNATSTVPGALACQRKHANVKPVNGSHRVRLLRLNKPVTPKLCGTGFD